jgi:hypothetical protein
MVATCLRDLGFRELQDLAVCLVHLHRDIPRDLQVLLLVLTDRHDVRLVEEDVGGLQDRIGEERVHGA